VLVVANAMVAMGVPGTLNDLAGERMRLVLGFETEGLDCGV